MRAAPWVVVLLVALPAVTAQDVAPAAAPLLEDPSGDATVSAGAAGAGTPAPLPGGDSEAVKSADLLALALVESEDDLAFRVSLASSTPTMGTATYEVFFVWSGETYRVVIDTYNYGTNGGNVGSFAALQRQDRTDWEWVSQLASDVAVGEVMAVVPKVYVLDGEMRAPGRGDVITGLAVTSLAQAGGLNIDDDPAGTTVQDAMPDSGEGAEYTFLLGDYATGTLTLLAEQRMRVSNGGATTIVYPVTLRNGAAVEDRLRIAAVDVPEGWGVRVPGSIAVAAKGEKTVNILASIPFAHKHGGFDSFNVTFQSERDPATGGKMRLGVLHTPIAQPAGHHNELFLHARDTRDDAFGQAQEKAFPYSWGWMNTNESHDGEFPGMSPNWYSDGESGFYVWLNPSLEIGLDFDVNELGSFVGSLTSTEDASASVTADLRLWHDGDNSDEGILLAESNVAEIDLARDQAVPFSLVMTPTPESDYVAFAPDQYMALEVRVVKDDAVPGVFITRNDLMLNTADFRLTLPLLEYHDRLDGLAEAESGITLVADGLVEKAGRPGTVQTYAFTLTNVGTSTMTVDLDVAGGSVEVGSLVPDEAVELDAGGSRAVTLAVSIPASATAEEAYEVLVFAHAVDDPSKTAIARTRTTVTFGAEANRDEADVLAAAREADRDAPASAAFAAVVAFAVAALGARRR